MEKSEVDPFQSTEPLEDVDPAPTESEDDKAAKLAEEEERAFTEGVKSVLNAGDDAPEAPETSEESQALIAGYTEEQLKAAMAKLERLDQLQSTIDHVKDSAFGQLGNLKQAIDELKGRKSKLNVSKDTFKNLSAYFEDENGNVAEALASDLAALELDSFDTEGFLNGIQERLEKISESYELKLLRIQHRDWEQVVASDEFQKWKSTLPPEGQAILDNSWDALEVGDAISRFKEHQKAKAELIEKRQRRLEENMPVKGGSDPVVTQFEEDAFRAGYNSVVKNL